MSTHRVIKELKVEVVLDVNTADNKQIETIVRKWAQGFEKIKFNAVWFAEMPDDNVEVQYITVKKSK